MYGNSPLPGKEKGSRVFAKRVEVFCREGGRFLAKGSGLSQKRWRVLAGRTVGSQKKAAGSEKNTAAFEKKAAGFENKHGGLFLKRQRALKSPPKPLNISCRNRLQNP
ncbi:hypothetical protein [Bacteroides pyogenes]|uniref:hypothetical protein n=1 Tax=Bacteroides pyogenes TaxID=310300 RepID=UPI000E15A289|nr:hypothetical protein [Bacteroides pyogenes]MBB3895992.1 hypothetical protein [Bacteroides pyogenes]SUV36177.1 Uncharacterised protein [Bacteroides pyogenes]